MVRLFWAALLLWYFGGEFLRAEPVRVMSWNLRYDNPQDGKNAWQHRKEWVAEIIREQGAEVAGFQEVLAGQLEDLKVRLPEMEAYGVGRNDGKSKGEFAPIFFRRERFEVLGSGTFWLSPTPEVVGSVGWDAALPRIASWVTLKDRKSGEELCVMNTHFDHRGEKAREESARLIVKMAREKFVGLPLVLTGDFNTRPGTTPYEILVGEERGEGRGFRDAYVHAAEKPVGPNSTWNGFEEIVPEQRIDFVFASPRMKVQRVRILEDQREGRFPSDHLAVVGDVGE